MTAYDPQCLELAKYFLQAIPNWTEEDAAGLAQAVQATVEEWMPGIEEAARERRSAS